MNMSFLFDGSLGLIWILLSAFTGIWLYSSYRFNYWSSRKIPSVNGYFPFGSLGDLFLIKTSLTEKFLDLYNKNEGKEYVGFYSFFNPQLLIRDLKIIKNVLVKDFNVFVDRGMYSNEKVDPLSAHLFTIEGVQWKNLRAKLSPVFTSGKMKMMFPTVKKCSLDLQQYCSKLGSENDIFDIKDVTGRYGLDVISSTALGLEGNNFKEDETEMKKIAQLFSAPTIVQMFRLTMSISCKSLARVLRLRLVPKIAETFFMNVVEQITNYRLSNNIEKNDFMQLLIEMYENNNKIKKKTTGDGPSKRGTEVCLTMKEMAAQSFVFVVAGFDTASVTLGFCMYELAMNPHIQEKLIMEIDAAGTDISYEALIQLPYLEMVLCETLRKYPPVPTLQRECSTNYKLPGGQTAEKGTNFFISVIGLHRDPTFFPNPEVFDPERFNKDNIKNIQPYSYLPFGEGPRNCLGMRFGKMQVKLALLSLLSHFTVETSEKTPIPIPVEKKTFFYNVEGGVWLRLKERNNKICQ